MHCKPNITARAKFFFKQNIQQQKAIQKIIPVILSMTLLQHAVTVFHVSSPVAIIKARYLAQKLINHNYHFFHSRKKMKKHTKKGVLISVDELIQRRSMPTPSGPLCWWIAWYCSSAGHCSWSVLPILLRKKLQSSVYRYQKKIK